MSARVHRRLQASIEYMVLGDLAQCVLNALWRAGHEQRFEPLGSLTARDVILVRLRQLGMLQREGAGAVLDELLTELVAARAIRPDGDVLVLPILSADKPRVQRAPSMPPQSPEEAAQRQDEERRRENFERAFREYRRARRATGDTRLDAVLREEFRGVYREKRGRSARTSAEPPAEAPRSPEDPGARTSAEPPHPPAEGSSLLSLSSENSQEREERETPEEDVVARAGARAELGAEDPRGEDPAPRRIRPEDRRDGGSYGRGDHPLREHPEREPGGSAPSPEEAGGAPAQPPIEVLSNHELGALGLKGLELAGRVLKAGVPAAQVHELGALMREHGLTPEQLAGAGRFLGQVDVRTRYDWEATVAAKGEVTLHFLLGKRLADGRREGDRLLALVTEGEAFRARTRSPSAQGSLPLGSSARGPAAGAPSRPAAPLSLAQQRAREIEARQASGEQPRVSGLAFGARPGPGPVSAGGGGPAGASETG